MAQKKVGRPTKYNPIPLGESLSVEDAKAIGYPVCYGLCKTSHDDVFYVGSTKRPRQRFRAYEKGDFHKNNALSEKASGGFRVVLFDDTEGDIRKTEYKIIQSAWDSLCNIAKCDFSHKFESRYKYTHKFMRDFSVRFRNERAKAYLKWFREQLKNKTPADMVDVECYFEAFYARAN